MNRIFKTNRKELCVITECPFCGKTSEVEINADDYSDYMDGILLVQEAFPYLSPDDRERLISGICPDCWDNMFCETFGDEGTEEPFDTSIFDEEGDDLW